MIKSADSNQLIYQDLLMGRNADDVFQTYNDKIKLKE